jgi:hypothetical protein
MLKELLIDVARLEARIADGIAVMSCCSAFHHWRLLVSAQARQTLSIQHIEVGSEIAMSTTDGMKLW